MSAVTVRRRVAAPPEEVWERVTDVRRHGDHVPLTAITQDEQLRLGSLFVARTAVGPLGFDDPMVVSGWQPPPSTPARMRMVKTGALLAGWASIEVVPVAGGAEVAWTEEIVPTPSMLRPLARLVDPIARRATAALLARVLDGVLTGLPPVDGRA